MKPYWRAAAWYLVFGVTWIFATDQWLDSLAEGTAVLTAMQTMKGWLFILLSAALVFVLTKRAADQRAALEAEKLAVFRKTVEGAHHILLNYVNQMQIVTMTAEECPGFDPSILKIADEVSGKVVAELKKLDRISQVTSAEIDAVIYEDLRKRP
jgi:hypothetical protein